MGDYSYTVAGKTVQFKRRLTLNEQVEIEDRLKATEGGKLADQIALVRLLIESWGFEGDPSDAAAYGDLDIFEELLPVIETAGKYITDKRAAANPKHSGAN